MSFSSAFKIRNYDKKKSIENELDKYQFTLESERKYFINLLSSKDGASYKKALFKNENKTFYKTIRDSVVKKTNLIILINGFTASGKSICAQSILHIIRREFEKEFNIEYPMRIVFDREEFRDVLRTTKPPFGLVKDEETSESGKDSQLNLEAIKNITESIRAKQISIIMCTPLKKGATFINFRLLMCGTDKEKDMLRAFIFFADRQKPAGIIEISYHKNKKMEEEYKKKKEEFLDEMLRTGGYAISKFSRQRLERDFQHYYNKIKETYGTVVKDVEGIVAFLERDGYEETENFKYRLARLIKNEIRNDINEAKMAKKRDKELQVGLDVNEYGISTRPFMIWEDLNFKHLLLERLKNKVTNEEYKVFSKICDGESYRYIASQIKDMNIRKINHIKDKIQQKILGYLGEEIFHEMLISQGKQVDHFGENSKEPDFIVHSDREVVSFKTYTLPNREKARKEVATSEILAASRLGYKCYLLIYEVQPGLFLKYCVTVPQKSDIFLDQSSGPTPPKNESITPPPSHAGPRTAPADKNNGTMKNDGAEGVAKVSKKRSKTKRRRRR
ncbi:MAG: hypothetical protein ACTSSI_08420 [Candidatus Helarchaeota archaeon]